MSLCKAGRRPFMSNGNWLWRHVRPLRWMLLLAVLLSLLDMVSLLGITGIQKWLIDDVFVDGQYDRLYPYLGIFAALIIGYNAVHLFSFLLNRSNEFALQKKLTTDLMHYMYRMKVSKYASDRIGSIAQRFSGDIGETGWLSATISLAASRASRKLSYCRHGSDGRTPICCWVSVS